jgi:hypothetical protein
MPKPFRWSIARREQLGSFADALATPPHAAFLDELRTTAARVLAFADDADLAFIGRTPENFYDYLSGAFAEVEGAPKLHLVQFSLRWVSPGDTATLSAENIAALGEYFEDEGVDPTSIAKGARPLALVDMVHRGGTMENLVRILNLLARAQRVDWNAVQRRLKIIGLVDRTKNSPNTWRWQQNQNWLDLVPDTEIKNVSASLDFISYITGMQPKVTHSFDASRWREGETGAPETQALQREAIAHAAFLYDLGRSRAERHALAALIAESQQMRQAATRALVLGLKG